MADALAAPRALSDAEIPETAKLPASVNPLVDGVFMAHQRDWLEDQAPLKLCEKGRRTGITFAQAWEDTLVAAASRSAGGDNCFYIPDAKEKGLEYIGYVRHFARCIGEELKALEEFLFEDKREDGETRFISAYRARFASGCSVVALSSRPANIRGLQGRVTIDEAAFHRDVGLVLAAVMALLIWGGRVRVISTHNGVANPFNALVLEARAGKSAFHLHTYTFDDAVENGLYERVCLKRGTRPTAEGKAEWYRLILAGYGGDDEARQQELFCKPAAGGGAWLSFEIITACEHEEAGKPALYQGGPCSIGNDIGRRGDLWVAWVWEQVGDVQWCREISVLKNATFAEQDAELDRLVGAYRVHFIAMDQTGMGEKPVEDAKRRYPNVRVEGVLFSSAVRLNLATIGRSAFEDRKVRIPAGDPELRADLHKLKRVQGETGNPRLVADRDEAGHADRTWAGFLGLAHGAPVAALLEHVKRQVEASEPARKAYEAIRGRLEKAKARVGRKPPG